MMGARNHHSFDLISHKKKEDSFARIIKNEKGTAWGWSMGPTNLEGKMLKSFRFLQFHGSYVDGST